VNSASPSATSTSPGTSVAFAPKRRLSLAETPSDSVPMITATGRNASPVSIAS